MTELRIPRPRAEVVPWTDDLVSSYRMRAWDAWLHGSVAVVERDGHDLLVVPLDAVTRAGQLVAERLYRLGAVLRLA